jgi:hypothetical protein
MAKLPFSKKTTLPDLTSMSLDELTALHTHVGKHLVDRKEARIKELQAELRSLGATGGGDPFGIKKAPDRIGNGKPADGGDRVGNGKPAGGGKTCAKPAAKYKDDKGNSWTGRGATPKWLAAYIAEGKSKDDFLA